MLTPLTSQPVSAKEMSSQTNLDEFQKIKVTPEEMVNIYAKDMNMSFNEALNYFPKDFLYESRSTVSYEIYTKVLNITEFFYRPQLRLYVKEIDGLFSSVYNTSIDTQGKQFNGRIFVHVESDRSIYHQVEGHFYDTGSTTVSGGINLGIGGVGSINFTVSTTKGAMAYVNFDGHIRK